MSGGGSSVFALLEGLSPEQRRDNRFFRKEINQEIKLDRPGLVCMAPTKKKGNGSEFFITLSGSGLEYLDGENTIFGEVAEGLEKTMKIISEVHVDESFRPYRDVRIIRTHILLDPFPDRKGLPTEVPGSPEGARPAAEVVEERIAFLKEINENAGLDERQVQEKMKENESKSRAVVLEMVGDLPDADIKPPDNVLFVCKLNPVTQDEDLEIIFSRFGNVKSCEIIRDKETGNSLQYAFIEFETKIQCEEAYFKMDNVLIDDRRIKVDFSQSVSKMWNRFTRGKLQRNQNSQARARDAPAESSKKRQRLDSSDDKDMKKNEKKKRKKDKKRKR